MLSVVTCAVLLGATGILVTAPAIEGTVNRSILYWAIIPPLLMGAIAFYSHNGSL